MSRHPETKIFTIRLPWRIHIISCCERPETHKVNDNCMPKCIEYPFRHLKLSEASALHSELVKIRVSHEVILVTLNPIGIYSINFLGSIPLVLKVKDGIPNDRERSKCYVIQLINEFFVKWLPSEG